MMLVAPDAVRDEVARILADERFANSQHLSRLLRFVVEETLDGRGDSLKETVLGLEVFGRGTDFDPRIDPIVRVQAAKVRSRLKEYYEGSGGADPVRIELPKGTYVPVFHPREAAAPTAAPPAGTPTRRIRFPLRMVVFAGLGVAAVTLAGWLFFRRPPPEPPLEVRPLTFDAGTTTFPAISADGKWLAYSSDRGGKGDLDLWVQQVGGSDPPAQITRDPAADITPDLSPDGTHIVFRSQREGGGIYIVSISGTGERKLTGNGWRPRFSPDGKFIVYQGASGREGGDMYVIPFGGGQPRLVPVGNTVWLFGGGGPHWTPDGRYLLFTASTQSTGADPDWWVAPQSGGTPVRTGLRDGLRRLGADWTTTAPGGWIGSRFIFCLLRQNGGTLWEAPFSPKTWTLAGPPRKLRDSSALEEEPRVSRTGQIVFTSEQHRTHLWELRLRPDGSVSEPRQLTQDLSLVPGAFWYVPRFSARGNLLVYASERSGNRDIWLKDLASGAESALTVNPAPEDQPMLSPDGSRVVWQIEEGARFALQLADLRSRVPKTVCTDCGPPEDWSPDGRRVLYIADGQHAVFALDLESGQRTEVLRNPRLRFRHAALSPDQRWLAATPHGDPTFLIPLEQGNRAVSGEWKTILKDTSVESAHWSRDGKLLYFISREHGHACVWAQRVNLAAGEPIGAPFVIQDFHSRRQPWSTWISVDETRLVVRATEAFSNIFMASASGRRAP